MNRTNLPLACVTLVSALAFAPGCGSDASTTSAGTTEMQMKPTFTGAPITAADKTWTWVDFPGAKCRDGSDTGIGVNFNAASDKVMIYMEGGGACYNAITCGTNPAKYGAADFTGRNGWHFRSHRRQEPSQGLELRLLAVLHG